MARRVNTKVVGIITITAVGLAGGIFAAEKLLRRQHPEQFVQTAQDAQKRGDWVEAVADWTKALQLAPKSPDYWKNLGDAEHKLAESDPEEAGRDAADWKQALVVQPNYSPAIKALAEYYHDESHRAHGGDATSQVAASVQLRAFARQYAQEFIQVAPDDAFAPQAEVYLYTTIIDSWLAGQESNTALIEDTETKAQALMAKHPEFVELPFYLARVQMKRGTDLATGGTSGIPSPQAAAAFKKAADEIGAAVKAQPANAMMHYYAAGIYQMLASFDRSSPETMAQNRAAAARERDAAIATLKPDDPHYTEVCLGMASQDMGSNEVDKGKEIVRQFLKEKGSDPMAVMMMTPLLTDIPELHPQAMSALQSGLDEGPKTAALSMRNFALRRALMEMQLTDLEKAENAARASMVGATSLDPSSDAAGKALDKLKDDVKQNLQTLVDSNFDPLDVTQYRVRFAMADHDYVSAIEILNTALSTNTLRNNPNLDWQLAQAYFYANERAQAKDYANKVLDAFPRSVPARMMLVRILSAEGTPDAQRQIADQLAFLRRFAPDEPEVITLELQHMDPATQADAMQKLLAKLPEDNTRDVLVKAQLAAEILKNTDEADRILSSELERNPADIPAALSLAGVYGAAGRKADALVVVEKSLVSNPKNGNLLLMQKQLEDASPVEIKQFREKLAEGADEVGADLYKASEALQQGDTTKAEQFLKAAELIKPNDKYVLDQFFRLYLQTKQWDKIDKYTRKLGEVNFDQAHGLLYAFEVAKGKKDAKEEMATASRLMAEAPEFAMSYFCMGQAYQAAGQYQEAIDNYDTALQKKGVVKDAAVMMEAKINCYDQMNQPDRALVAIAEARMRFPENNEFKLMQIRHELSNGDPAAAVADLEPMLKDHPDLPEAYLDLSEARMRVVEVRRKDGDLQGAGDMAVSARDLMKDAMKRFPDDSRVYKRLSEILSYGGDQAGAEQILQMLAARPMWAKDAEPQSMLGQLYVSYRLWDKAEAAYARAMDLATPSNKGVIQARYADVLANEGKFDQALSVLGPVSETDDQVGRQRANILVQAGKYDEAEAQIKTMLAHNAPDTAILQTGWAQLELALNKRDSAAEHLELALAADPKCVPALVQRAKIRMLKSPPDMAGATSDLNTARLIKPTDVDTLVTLSDVYSAQSNNQEAVRVLQSALRNSPADYSIRFRLAYILSNSAPIRLDDAMRVLQDGLAQPGGNRNPDLYNNIAAVYEQKGDLNGAVKTVTDAINQMPGTPVLIRSYLRLMSEAKQYQSVVDASSTVLKGKPDVWWALQYRGQARAKLGDKNGGLDDLTQALTLLDNAHDFASSNGIIRSIAQDIGPDPAIGLVKARIAKDNNWEVTLMLLYHQQHHDDLAIPVLETYMDGTDKLPPPQQASRLQLAAMLYGDAQPKPFADKAYVAYKQLLALNPDDIQTLNNFACLCADAFDPPKTSEGLATVRHALEILARRGSSDPLVDDTYGWLLILSGQTNDGMDVVRKALTRQTFPEGYYHLGEAYLRLNRPEDAQQQVNLALGEIAKSQDAARPVSSTLRVKVEDLSNRILDKLRARTSGALP